MKIICFFLLLILPAYLLSILTVCTHADKMNITDNCEIIKAYDTTIYPTNWGFRLTNAIGAYRNNKSLWHEITDEYTISVIKSGRFFAELQNQQKKAAAERGSPKYLWVYPSSWTLRSRTACRSAGERLMK